MKELLVGIGIGALITTMLRLFLKLKKKDHATFNRLPFLTPNTDKTTEKIEKEKEVLKDATQEEKATHVSVRLDRFRKKK